MATINPLHFSLIYGVGLTKRYNSVTANHERPASTGGNNNQSKASGRSLCHQLPKLLKKGKEGKARAVQM